MSQLPSSVHAVVIGAGIHGLSTGWHLGLDSQLSAEAAPRAGCGSRRTRRAAGSVAHLAMESRRG